MNGIHDAYAARKAANVMDDTWGHLKPKARATYAGFILYTQGCYGDIVCIESDFVGLTSSPWLYEDIHDFIGDNDEEDGNIYLWRGTYCRSRGSKFVGRFQKMSSSSIRALIEGK